MGKYFGTDGFRGEANVNLTAEHAYKIGRFLGWYYGELKKQKQLDEPAKIVIGKDTRRFFLYNSYKTRLMTPALYTYFCGQSLQSLRAY